MALAALSGTLSGKVTEDSTLDVNGTVFISGGDTTGGEFFSGIFAGIYGELTVTATGVWSYKLANSLATVQSLAGNTESHDYFGISWGYGSVEGEIDIVVQGANDSATIAGDLTKNLNVVAAASVSGQIEISDVDIGEKAFRPATQTGKFGTLTLDKTGAWQYDLLPGQRTAILDESKNGTETFSISSVDGTLASVTITVSSGAVPDTTAPTAVTFNPTDEATGIALSSNIIVTFSEAIIRGTGNILLKNAAGTVIETFNVATSSNLSLSGNTLTLNPTADLGYSTGYKVEFASGTVKDLAGNSYTGTTTYNFTSVEVTTSPITTTNAKVFLGSGDDNFSVSNSGTTLYGNTGNNIVTIAAGVTDVILDQNIEKIKFAGVSSSYTFKQTGNMINIYDASGLIVKAPVQGDSDGTLLSFSNCTALTKLTGGVMTLGDTVVSSGTAEGVTPSTTISEPSMANVTNAKVFLGSGNDSFTVSSIGTTLYGNTGNDAVTIASAASAVSLDQNIERINFSGASNSYAFKQTGNLINIYEAGGITLLAKAPVQGDANGTLLSFSDVTASALLAAGVMRLGGITVAATPLTLVGLAAADIGL